MAYTLTGGLGTFTASTTPQLVTITPTADRSTYIQPTANVRIAGVNTVSPTLGLRVFTDERWLVDIKIFDTYDFWLCSESGTPEVQLIQL